MTATAPVRPPLGLPRGSVRAIVTLMIVAVVIVLTVREEPLTALLAETLMVALAHYFTSRRLIKLPPDVKRKLEADGILEHEPHPLYLPQHAVRVIIVLAFMGLAAWLIREEKIWKPDVLSTLVVVFAYFLGVILSSILLWRSKRTLAGTQTLVWWEDLKAVAVMLAIAGLLTAYLLGQQAALPDWFANGTFGLILFYFGSR